MTNQLTFRSTVFNPVHHANKIWFTAVELAKALEYKKSDAVTQIYERNSDEFTSAMTETLKMRVSGNYQKTVRVFSLRGAHLIAIFSKTSVAKEFRKWVLDILDREVEKSSLEVTKTTTNDRTPLRGLVNTLMGKYGVSNKKLFQMIHHEFGVGHINELTNDQLPSAIEYLATKAIEGEFLGKETLPAPEVKQQIPDDDLQNLCWLWQHSINMARYMIDVEPILKVAEHKLAGEYYSYPRNAIKCANSVRRILEKATEHIQIKPVQKDNWKVLHKLRIPNCPF